MRKIAGEILVILSILFMAIITLGVLFELDDIIAGITEGSPWIILLVILLDGTFFIVWIIVFLFGQYLKYPYLPIIHQSQEKKKDISHPFLLVIFLAVSIGIAIMSTLGTGIEPQIKSMWILIGQPRILAMLMMGLIGRFSYNINVITNPVMAFISLIYFIAFFFPIYRLITIKRAIEIARFRRMKLLLILFIILHILAVFLYLIFFYHK
jgi:hypothetical protein